MHADPRLRKALAEPPPADRAAAIRAALGQRSLVLIGLMGAGKSTVGKKLANRLGLSFVDLDAAIEAAAGMTVPEIFATKGEPCFRDGERRVLARLLGEGRHVVATGGGAFMNADSRQAIAEAGISIWLKADLDILMRRVRKRNNRPLLQNADPDGTLRKLMDERYPVYATADLTVISNDGPHESVVDAIVEQLARRLLPNAAQGEMAMRGAGPPVRDVTPAQMAGRASATRIVPVALGDRAYDIVIGRDVIDAAGARIAALAPGATAAVVTDETVAGLHAARLERALAGAGIATARIVIAPGEGSKSWNGLTRVCDALIGARIERGDIVVALGGGVVGDLAGFAAAVVRRGMRFVQVPTTLLAQVDSSVGGKTGINTVHGKNLVGAFHQPALVLADTALLDTLPEREFRAGYAEVIKYGLIDNRDFFSWCEVNHAKIFAGGPEREHAVTVSCAAKAAIVARDETETGDRALLNLGHTFGHALERVTGYDAERLVHGEAVAIGLALAFRFSVHLGFCNGQDATRVARHLQAIGLPTRLQDVPGGAGSVETLLDAMAQDKKVVRGALTFILTRGIGGSFVQKGVPAAEVEAFLNEEMQGA